MIAPTLPDDPSELKKYLFSLYDDLSKYKETNSILENKYALLKNEHTSLNSNYTSLNGNYKTLVNSYSSLEKNTSELINRNQHLEKQNSWLLQQLKLAKNFRFAHKSEKWIKQDDKQAFLFNEIEISSKPQKEKEEYVEIKAHKRRKKGRKPLDPSLTRIPVLHDISAEEKICGCGSELRHIRDDVNEKLEFVPAFTPVEKHTYPLYVCDNCDRDIDGHGKVVVSAPREPSIIPKSFATPGLIAYIMISKFLDHLPLYRLERIFKRLGVELGRATMSNWMIKCSKKFLRIIACMRRDLHQGKLIQADESPMQVLNEPGKPNRSKSYMWIFRGGDDIERPIIIYKYHPTRAGEVAKNFIGKKFKGVILSDAYSGYNIFTKNENIINANCWFHVRRKFKESLDVEKEVDAKEALLIIQKLNNVEDEIIERKLSDDEILKIRQEKSKPLVEKFRLYLERMKLRGVNPKSLFGIAVNHALKIWPRLLVFLDIPYVPIHNNRIENDVRPFALGRRNWLFAGCPMGAVASMTIYTLIMSAIANGLDPYIYLRYILEKIPYAKTRADFHALAPNKIKKEIIEKYELPRRYSVVK